MPSTVREVDVFIPITAHMRISVVLKKGEGVREAKRRVRLHRGEMEGKIVDIAEDTRVKSWKTSKISSSLSF